MSEQTTTDWTKLTVVQLKGALVRRALDSDGSKEELVKRLTEYDENATEKKNVEVEKETADLEPLLPLTWLNTGSRIIQMLKTVVITPFESSLMGNPDFIRLIEQTSHFTIKKNNSGVSAAELVFDTTDQGDAALADLKSQFGEAINFYHPRKKHVSKNSSDARQMQDFETLIDDEPIDDLRQRLVVLENLPAELNTEEKLAEFFPEARQTTSYQYNIMSQGIGVLEFNSVQEMNDYLSSVGDSLKLNGVEVLVSTYTKKLAAWNSRYHLEVWPKEKEEKEIETDEDRVSLNTDINQMNSDLDKLIQGSDVIGYDKVLKIHSLEKKIHMSYVALKHDTRKRIEANELTMPEAEDEMQDYTKLDIMLKKGEKSKEMEKEHEKEMTELNCRLHQNRLKGQNIVEAIKKLKAKLTLQEKKELLGSNTPDKQRRPRRRFTQADGERPRLRNGVQGPRKYNLMKDRINRARKQAISRLKQNRVYGAGGNNRRPNNSLRNRDTRPTEAAQNRARRDNSRSNQNAGRMRGGANRRPEDGDRNGGRQRGTRAGRGNRRGGRGRRGGQNDASPRNQDNRSRIQQKRPGRRMSGLDMDEPPSKIDRRERSYSANYNRRGDTYADAPRRDRRDRRSDPFSDRDTGYGFSNRQSSRYDDFSSAASGSRDPAGSMKLIEGITSALTDKMMQLQEMQSRTLQTQASLLSDTSYSRGNMNYGSSSGQQSFPDSSSSLYGIDSRNVYDRIGSDSSRNNRMLDSTYDSSYGSSGYNYGTRQTGDSNRMNRRQNERRY